MSKDITVKLTCGCGAAVATIYPVGFNPWELSRWLEIHASCCTQRGSEELKALADTPDLGEGVMPYA